MLQTVARSRGEAAADQPFVKLPVVNGVSYPESNFGMTLFGTDARLAGRLSAGQRKCGEPSDKGSKQGERNDRASYARAPTLGEFLVGPPAALVSEKLLPILHRPFGPMKNRSNQS
jgi:hypothetical protein